MRLYANITSERAKKGQGGNQFITIDFLVGETDNSRKVAEVSLTRPLATDQNKYQIKFTPIIQENRKDIYLKSVLLQEGEILKKEKGKKQKSEKLKCPYCGNQTQSAIETGDNHAGGVYKFCKNCHQNFNSCANCGGVHEPDCCPYATEYD